VYTSENREFSPPPSAGALPVSTADGRFYFARFDAMPDGKDVFHEQLDQLARPALCAGAKRRPPFVFSAPLGFCLTAESDIESPQIAPYVRRGRLEDGGAARRFVGAAPARADVVHGTLWQRKVDTAVGHQRTDAARPR